MSHMRYSNRVSAKAGHLKVVEDVVYSLVLTTFLKIDPLPIVIARDEFDEWCLDHLKHLPGVFPLMKSIGFRTQADAGMFRVSRWGDSALS